MGFRTDWFDIARDKGLIATPIVPVPPLDCSEKTFQAAVMKLARDSGWLAFHVYDSRRSEPGFPDTVLIRDGKLLIVELKTEVGIVSPEQTIWLCALKSCGVDARTWRPSHWQSEIVPTLTAKGKR